MAAFVTRPSDGVLGVIPARGGSKSIRQKNLASLGGKPLIEYTISHAFSAATLDEVIVSTDSEEIASVARKLGASIPFIRPAHLATDTAPSIDVVLHALHFMEQLRNRRFRAVALLQPTTPFRPQGLIDDAILRLMKSDLDSVVSVVDVGAHHPYRMYELDDASVLSPVMKEVNNPMLVRQLLPKIYIRSGDVYVTRRECLVQQHSLLGERSSGLVIPSDIAVNIDSERDLEFARHLLAMRSMGSGR